jgi:nucleoside-diphosphate-sugar epimerase
LSEPPALFVLISTTGVYGDCGADWVDETRQPKPMVDRALRRLDAEQQLVSWCEKTGTRYVILRVPGIYGPGKLPLERLRAGKPVLKVSESPWSNRIHVDDLVQACTRCLDYTGENSVFNVSDGHPSTMTDYFNAVAKRFNIPQPPQITLEECRQQFSANMMSYLTESKRIDNTRMLEQLGVELRYPDLEQGLEMIPD